MAAKPTPRILGGARLVTPPLRLTHTPQTGRQPVARGRSPVGPPNDAIPASAPNGVALAGQTPLPTDAPSTPIANKATVATRIRRGVIQAKPFAPSHARTPVAPPTAAAAVVAPIAHCTHMDQA